MLAKRTTTMKGVVHGIYMDGHAGFQGHVTFSEAEKHRAAMDLNAEDHSIPDNIYLRAATREWGGREVTMDITITVEG